MDEDRAVSMGSTKYLAYILAPIATGAITVVGVLVLLMWNSVTDQISRLDQRVNNVQAAQNAFLRTAADRQMAHQADILELIQRQLKQYDDGTKYEVSALHQDLKGQRSSTSELEIRLVEMEKLFSVLLPASGPANDRTPQILQGVPRQPYTR